MDRCVCNAHSLLTILVPSGANPWWNPLGNPDIGDLAAAGNLWAWRAQANSATWGVGPSNYAASLVEESRGIDLLVAVAGAPNWSALTGWSGFLNLLTALNTQVTPEPAGLHTWGTLIQYSGQTLVTQSAYYGVENNPLTDTFHYRYPGVLLGQYCSGRCENSLVNILASGNVGMIGTLGYLNGVVDSAVIGAYNNPMNQTCYIGAQHRSNGAMRYNTDVNILAFWMVNDISVITNADRLALAGLPDGSMHNL